MEPFEEQLKFWTDNGFIGDMIRISRNAERFIEILSREIGKNRPKSGSGSSLDEKHAWNGFVRENSHLLSDLYDPSEFVMGWLNSGHESKKEEVLQNVHIHKACVVQRKGTPDVNGQCAWCRLLEGKVTFDAEEIDHIIPFSFFPQFDGQEWNYQGLCKHHNRQKGSFPAPVQTKMTSEEMLQYIWADLT